MNTQNPASPTPYFFKKIKTYSAEEIIAAGGTTAFGKVTQYERHLLEHLTGESLTEVDYQQAIAQLSK